MAKNPEKGVKANPTAHGISHVDEFFQRHLF